ncbi:MAG: 3-oxoacyl-ACP synthase [Acidobacteria bacterium]|nr:3-oxoacyl-ACP synthase [Acidobacteriota bacterium]
MKEKLTGKTSAKTGAKSGVKQATDWKRVRSRSETQVRRAIAGDSEARATDAEFWKNARVVMPLAKETITIRLDADLLEWLRKQKRYQTRINAVLRSYMHGNMGSRRLSAR